MIIESIIRSAVVWHIGSIHAIGAGSGFMLPLGTILQPYIDLTCLLFAEVIYNAFPVRIFCRQCYIDTAVLIYITGTSPCRTFGGDHITDHIHITVLCLTIFYIHIDCTTEACQ